MWGPPPQEDVTAPKLSKRRTVALVGVLLLVPGLVWILLAALYRSLIYFGTIPGDSIVVAFVAGAILLFAARGIPPD